MLLICRYRRMSGSADTSSVALRHAVSGTTGRSLLLRLQLGQVLVHDRDRHAPLSYGGRHTLDGGVADVADREDARHAGLQEIRIALQRPACRRTLERQVHHIAAGAAKPPAI